MRKVLALIATAALAASACSSSGGGSATDPTVDLGRPGEGVTLASALTRFQACEDFLSHVQTEALEIVGPWGLGGGFYGGGIAVDVLEESADESSSADGGAAAPRAAQSTGGGEAGVDFSTTNVQEVGVDEPDIVKTDGSTIVALAQGQLRVIDVRSEEPVLRGSLALEGVWAQEMFMIGDRVLLLAHSDRGSIASASGARVIGDSWWYTPISVFVEVDISDPTAPRVAHELHLDGRYLSARMIDGVARVVTSSGPTGFDWAYPEGGGLRSERAAQEANEELIRNSEAEDWLPYYILRDGGGDVVREGSLVECDRAYHPEEFSGLNLLNVVTVDLGDGGLEGAIDGVGVLADGETVYGSTEALYVGTTRWLDPVAFEERAAADLPDISTAIHKFDISDPTRSEYVASGTVEGTVLNQYSMSEHAGHLRVATTAFDWWGRRETSESFLTVLDERDGSLVEVGKVGELGLGERIFAVRFLGDIATVVTFRQTDPLYTIDLSDPQNPAVLGELKILGYSAYLHPLGDDLVLGVGQDATEEGRTLGTQVSLFDISDLTDPQRIDQWTMQGGWTDVEFNARAFLHWAPQNLVVLPVNVWGGEPERDVEAFVGAVALGVDDRTITERQRITHAEPGKEFCEQWIETDPSGEEIERRYCWVEQDWQAQIRRSVVVGDSLFTLSDKGLLASDLATLAPGGFVPFNR